jgi:hypothetical protein
MELLRIISRSPGTEVPTRLSISLRSRTDLKESPPLFEKSDSSGTFKVSSERLRIDYGEKEKMVK